jgi:hypothetical protein
VNDRYRAFGKKLSEAIIANDYAAADALLAPWLQGRTALREGVEARIRDMLVEWGIEEPIHPTACDLDGNSAITVETLREPDWDDSIPDVPAELTDANFRYWMCLQFKPTEGEVEFDAFFDLWIALVEHDGAIRGGYFKFTDPD